MSMSELERATVTLNCAKEAAANRITHTISGQVPDWIKENIRYWKSRVAALDAAEPEAEKPDLADRLFEHGQRQLEQGDHLSRLLDVVADIQSDLKLTNKKIDRVNSKVEEDNKRASFQSAEIHKVREWCGKHQHRQGAIWTKSPDTTNL